jgi:hypothetical protein
MLTWAAESGAKHWSPVYVYICDMCDMCVSMTPQQRPVFIQVGFEKTFLNYGAGNGSKQCMLNSVYVLFQ